MKVNCLILFFSFFCTSMIGQADQSIQRGFTCAECIDFLSAQRQAELYADSLDCLGDGVGCSDSPARLILGNVASGQVYAFHISRDTKAPYAVHAEQDVMATDERGLYASMLKFLDGWISGHGQIQALWNPDTGSFINHSDETSSPISSVGTGNCPDETAMSVLTDRLSLKRLEVFIQQVLEPRIQVGLEKLNISSSGISAQLKGVEGYLLFTGSSGYLPTVIRLPFNVGELSFTSADNPDELVFETRAVIDRQSKVTAKVNLSIAGSRVRGTRADGLFSRNPFVKITHQCILGRLAALSSPPSNVNQLQIDSVPVDMSDGFPGGGSNFCVYDHFLHGEYQYSFRAPCIE